MANMAVRGHRHQLDSPRGTRLSTAGQRRHERRHSRASLSTGGREGLEGDSLFLAKAKWLGKVHDPRKAAKASMPAVVQKQDVQAQEDGRTNRHGAGQSGVAVATPPGDLRTDNVDEGHAGRGVGQVSLGTGLDMHEGQETGMGDNLQPGGEGEGGVKVADGAKAVAADGDQDADAAAEEGLDYEDEGEDEELGELKGQKPPSKSGEGGNPKQHGQAYLKCPRNVTAATPNLEGLSLSLPEGNSRDDIFVTQQNYQRLLLKGMKIRERNAGLLPQNFSEAISVTKQWGSCAVVGSSGILQAGRFGRAIDLHDVVLRVNHAPTHGKIYPVLVGTKTTFRLLNHLWTTNYAHRYQKKHLPLEKNVTLLTSRTIGSLFEVIGNTMKTGRPDVTILMLTSRVVTMARRLLLGYRIRLCQAGKGPFSGGAVPTSGLVAILVFMHLCDRVTVYGFGRKIQYDETAPPLPKVPYHYFYGMGTRAAGTPVHCWEAEELLINELARVGHIKICSPFISRDREAAEVNYSCGMSEKEKAEWRAEGGSRSSSFQVKRAPPRHRAASAAPPSQMSMKPDLPEASAFVEDRSSKSARESDAVVVHPAEYDDEDTNQSRKQQQQHATKTSRTNPRNRANLNEEYKHQVRKAMHHDGAHESIQMKQGLQ